MLFYTKNLLSFYEQTNINNESDLVLKSSRLRLLNIYIKVVTDALGILGIDTVDSI